MTLEHLEDLYILRQTTLFNPETGNLVWMRELGGLLQIYDSHTQEILGSYNSNTEELLTSGEFETETKYICGKLMSETDPAYFDIVVHDSDMSDFAKKVNDWHYQNNPDARPLRLEDFWNGLPNEQKTVFLNDCPIFYSSLSINEELTDFWSELEKDTAARKKK